MRRIWLTLVALVVVVIALLLLRGNAGQATGTGELKLMIPVTVAEGVPCVATIAKPLKVVGRRPGEPASFAIANANSALNCAGGSITVRAFRHKAFHAGFCFASTDANSEFEVSGASFEAKRGNPKQRRGANRYCYTAELNPKTGPPVVIDPEVEIIWPN